VVFHKLRAVILHDGAFDDHFVAKYTQEPYITFVKVAPPVPWDQVDDDTIVVNDYRYVLVEQYLKEHAPHFNLDWFLITDMDIFFNKDPFEAMKHYSQTTNQTLFGSFDGRTWESEQVSLQRKLFRKCYGRKFLQSLTKEQWQTPNGNCGLWGGTKDKVQCILKCMAEQVTSPRLRSVNGGELCDMAVHDYCVQFGNCLSEDKHELRRGQLTLGDSDKDLFRPPYARRHESCLWDFAVVHNRCDSYALETTCLLSHRSIRQ
jgi:hypothetical protein